MCGVKRSEGNGAMPRGPFVALMIVGSMLCGGCVCGGKPKDASTSKLRNPALNQVAFEAIPAHPPVIIVKDGRPNAVIVAVAGNAAANELRDNLRAATGAELAIVDTAPADAAAVRIVVGGGLSVEDLPENGFRIATFPNGVAIAGKGDGVKFGVCDFSERLLGFRWYFPGPDGTVTPKLDTVELPPFRYSDYPRRRNRSMWPWTGRGIVPGDKDMTEEQLREQRPFKEIVAHFRAGRSGPSVQCHCFPNFGMHFKEHPDCFELQGRRNNHTPEGGMPCYGNPLTLKLHVEDVERFYRGDKTPFLTPPTLSAVRGAPSATQVSFSPPDKELECQCAFCKPMVNPAGGRWGGYSKVAATFAAALAKEVKSRWPDKVLTYLPYQNYTEPPEGVEFPDNVYAMVCLMYGVGTAKEPSVRETYLRWIAGWRKLTGHKVQLWEYICWPDRHSLPIMCLHVAKDFQRACADSSDGSFLNGCYAGPQDLPGGTWACGHPVIYGMFRLLWNPDYDVDAMLDEYVKLMYGPAAEPMGKLLNLLQDRWEKTRWSKVPDTYSAEMKLIHEETMPWAESEKLAAYLKEARALAGADGLWRRRVDFYGRAVDVFLKESALYHGKLKLPPLPELRAVTADAVPALDGKLDDACWARAEALPFQDSFISWSDAPPAQKTTVQAASCPGGVAFAFRMEEPLVDKMRVPHTSRFDYLDQDDSVELFLAPSGKGDAYYQVIINGAGASWDMLNTKKTDATWKRESLGAYKLGVARDRGKKEWTLEVFVDAKTLGHFVKGASDTAWKVNFVRNRRAGGDSSMQRWSTRFKSGNADPEAMGVVRLRE